MYFYTKESKMISFPGAKINIGLRVLSRRADGYHDIETFFYPVGLCDALEFVVPPANHDEDELTVTGIDINTRPDRNLIIKALKKLRERYPLPFLKIHLHKAIPSGAGLGGGSADAACMIRSADRCFNLGMNDREMKELALSIGSDCPFFLKPVPSIAKGRGEELTPSEPILKGYHLVLINPGIHISTRDAYLNSTPEHQKKELSELLSHDIGEWKKKVKNDFEDYAFKVYPVIGEIKKSLYLSGALYSSMSGSGSTVYGIFERKPDIESKIKKYVIWEGLL
ncbi:MAG TPA: 4-(cytidine 5'-diphospho)-2-C-methyl-D-erythritol kinase [Bacteroidales bacterium]|nr:4-(cytidine 5'-diphospho)-2-C-methyl-D-erythritol kinase [Bacteroidales bacterium]